MATFSVGDIVQTRNDATKYGPVMKVLEPIGGVQYYQVLLPHPQGLTMVAEDYLLPFSEVVRTPYDEMAQGAFSGYNEFLKVITVQRLIRNQPLKNTIYAFNASRTRFYPYQFKPLMKFLESDRYRVLICDEVGLGKTIEAGLILTEYRARFNVNRVLVVCPSNLREKWKTELKNRFDEEFRVLQTAEMMEFFKNVEEAETPERAPLNGIVSLETLRSSRCLERLEEVAPDFDIVLVDEAHHMRNFGRKQRRVGQLLSRGALAMVFLTATPVQLGVENLFSLLNILNPEEFPEKVTAHERFLMNEPVVMAQNCLSRVPPLVEDAKRYLKEAGRFPLIRQNPYYTEAWEVVESLGKEVESSSDERAKIRAQIEAQKTIAELNLIGHIYTRTKRREVHGEFSRRRAHPIEVEFTELEMEFYNRVTDYVRALCVERGHAPVIQKWVLNLPQRRMASSIPAMVEYYKKRFNAHDQTFREPPDEMEDVDESLQDEINGNGDLKETSVQVAAGRLREILSFWPENAVDSKYEKFRDALELTRRKERNPKILVFAFFKGTLRYLHKRLLEEGVRSVLISGDVPGEERAKLIEQFREDPETEVLLSSKVGTEGLDFQFCHVLFNYDLPWNPMEVEQRIGRLDRIGQESNFINIFHFWIKDTIEERILKRLYQRIGIFERSIGELELILGDIVRDLEFNMFSQDLSPEQEEEQLRQKLLALEQRRKELRLIEADAAKFIGTDMFFEQQVEETQKFRRYVTPTQIHSLVEDFIRNHAPKTRMEYDTETGKGKLYPGQDLLDMLARYDLLREFRSVTIHGAKGRDITFESEVAFKEPKREFVNILHPLIRGIARHYSENDANAGRCHFIRLSTPHLQPGFYFFFVYLFEVEAAKDQYYLEHILFNDALEEACDPEMSEFLFGEMLEKGRGADRPAPAFPADAMEELCNKAQSIANQRAGFQRERLQKTNDLFIDRRKSVYESFYGRILEQRRQRLEKEQRKITPDERIVRLLQGEIRNREAELRSKKEHLEARRKVDVTVKELCVGCIEVENGTDADLPKGDA